MPNKISESSFKDRVLLDINGEKTRLYQEALTVADSFWQAKAAAQEGNDKKDRCFIGTRVRLVRTSLVCEWFRFQTGINKQTGKRYTLSEYIPLGKQRQYSMRYFKHEPVWAQQMIHYCEEQYFAIRLRYEILNKMERLLKKLE